VPLEALAKKELVASAQQQVDLAKSEREVLAQRLVVQEAA
jgi:hypothetical protein